MTLTVQEREPDIQLPEGWEWFNVVQTKWPWFARLEDELHNDVVLVEIVLLDGKPHVACRYDKLGAANACPADVALAVMQANGIDVPPKTPVSGHDFQEGLAAYLNLTCRENASNTPDFLLAEYLTTCLEAFEKASNRREKWYGVKLRPVGMEGERELALGK